jgi:8-oxo-dGTP pyrophosphatase MutT (NUDIX family)
MAPRIYEDVLARNAAGLRSRARLNQETVAARMRALGYKAWLRQTVANVEKGKRRLTGGEIHALAHALQTTIAALMLPAPDDRQVEFPSDEAISVWSVQQLVRGMNVGAVAWLGNGAVPMFQFVEPANMADAELRRREIEGEQQQPVMTAVVTSDRGVLVGRRVDGMPPWTLIAGWSEPGESAEDTIVREVKEETGAIVEVGRRLGERIHPDTGARMIYFAAKPTHGTEIHVGDEAELAEVRWVSLAEADDLLPGMFGPVREHLAHEIGEGEES